MRIDHAQLPQCKIKRVPREWGCRGHGPLPGRGVSPPSPFSPKGRVKMQKPESASGMGVQGAQPPAGARDVPALSLFPKKSREMALITLAYSGNYAKHEQDRLRYGYRFL